MDSDLSLSPQEKKDLEMEIDPEATVAIKEAKINAEGINYTMKFFVFFKFIILLKKLFFFLGVRIIFFR
jgi:hypothetical protein